MKQRREIKLSPTQTLAEERKKQGGGWTEDGHLEKNKEKWK